MRILNRMLEYCFDDACISAFAVSLGEDSISEIFGERELRGFFFDLYLGEG